AAPVHEPFVAGAALDSATGTTSTGSVTVTEGADPVGTFDLAAGSGSLTVDAADLAIGGHTLTLSYGGDANHSPSTTTVDASINKATTPLTATASPSAYGTSAVVQVAGEPGAGGLVVIGSGTDAVGMGFLINGVANVKIDKTLVPGDYDLAVHYVGSPTYEPAQTTVTLTVGKAATLTSKVSISPTRLVVKKTAPLVKFSVKAAGFTVRSGSFTFMYAGTTRTVAVSSNGTATLRIPAYTSTGTKTIRGSFLGSALAKPSRASFTVTVVRR
ncbi:Ig-like domain repeat protein, partial [Aeromicrobium sp.]|uniref:Ig-like domain repeat protein n=1 Tax=Aeromicrobium sp. TaxID=1871063 RepID=UPI0019A06702